MDDNERDALVQRVAALEELAFELMGSLRAWNERRSKTADLFPLVPTPDPYAAARKALSDELVERFEKVTGRKYVFEGSRDGAALKKLLMLQSALRGELMERWEECLKMKGFPGTASLAVFTTRINSFGKKASGLVTEVKKGDLYT